MHEVRRYTIDATSETLREDLLSFIKHNKIVGFSTNPLSLEYIEEGTTDADDV